ncbi:hypothetical protein BC835DRAFT_1422711 [Cytidiella melzeri]|nr:hypothetical protein BC835DRAFT_1422711 [Cytidiella melzeri]
MSARKPSQILDTEKIVHLSDDDLVALDFLGPDAFPLVANFIQTVKEVPQQFEWLTVFRYTFPPESIMANSNEATLFSNSTETSLVSLLERTGFYHGISEDPPLLFHRSDLQQHPFVIRKDRFWSSIPQKTVHYANHAILKNQLCKETVAPEIILLCMDPSRGISISTNGPCSFLHNG